MIIKDKKNKQMVDVQCKNCLKRECYWPRPDPGVFSQGVGYKTRTGKPQWLCGNREIRGCPEKYCIANIKVGNMVTLKQLLEEHPDWADLPVAIDNGDGMDYLGEAGRAFIFEDEELGIEKTVLFAPN